MADLYVSREYLQILYKNQWQYSYHPHVSRKMDDKILPNYDIPKGIKNRYSGHSTNYSELTYSRYKEKMVAIVKELEKSEFKGMIINRGGHPKTNTSESCFRYLRKMIKDGILKMEKRNIHGYRTVSVLVISK